MLAPEGDVVREKEKGGREGEDEPVGEFLQVEVKAVEWLDLRRSSKRVETYYRDSCVIGESS